MHLLLDTFPPPPPSSFKFKYISIDFSRKQILSIGLEDSEKLPGKLRVVFQNALRRCTTLFWVYIKLQLSASDVLQYYQYYNLIIVLFNLFTIFFLSYYDLTVGCKINFIIFINHSFLYTHHIHCIDLTTIATISSYKAFRDKGAAILCLV